MFDQTIFDTLIVIGMFILRVGVPVAVLFVLARWLGKKLQPQEMQETQRRSSDGKIIPFVKPTSKSIPGSTARVSVNDETAKRTGVR
jgi:hypothetical protein